MPPHSSPRVKGSQIKNAFIWTSDVYIFLLICNLSQMTYIYKTQLKDSKYQWKYPGPLMLFLFIFWHKPNQFKKMHILRTLIVPSKKTCP